MCVCVCVCVYYIHASLRDMCCAHTDMHIHTSCRLAACITEYD